MVSMNFRLRDGGIRRISASPGTTLMETALVAELPGIDGECGGAGICGTCHIHIAQEWVDRLDPPSDSEKEMIEELEFASSRSRLACQITVTERLEGLEAEIAGEAE